MLHVSALPVVPPLLVVVPVVPLPVVLPLVPLPVVSPVVPLPVVLPLVPLPVVLPLVPLAGMAPMSASSRLVMSTEKPVQPATKTKTRDLTPAFYDARQLRFTPIGTRIATEISAAGAAELQRLRLLRVADTEGPVDAAAAVERGA